MKKEGPINKVLENIRGKRLGRSKNNGTESNEGNSSFSFSEKSNKKMGERFVRHKRSKKKSYNKIIFTGKKPDVLKPRIKRLQFQNRKLTWILFFCCAHGKDSLFIIWKARSLV